MYQKRKIRVEMKNNNQEEKLTKVGINWYPGHMAKAKREMKEKMNLIDIVYEVIDARMPLSSKIVDIDEIIKEKPRILLMTKYDLCDQTETDKIKDYYEQQGYQVIPLDLAKGTNVNTIFTKSEIILQQLNEKRANKGLKPRNLRALIIGVPNVGKSTLINRLVGKKAVQVGNRPGVTKSLGWIRINKNIDLLDTPGILWPKLENQEHAYTLALLSSIKEEILNQQDLAIFALNKLQLLYSEKLKKRYDLTDEQLQGLEKTLQAIATKRGAIKKRNQIDEEKVYQIILQDLKNNAFGALTLDRLS